MRTNFVLIDFENIQPESLAPLEQGHFKVIVFVGASQTKVPFEVATVLQRMGVNAEYVKISGNGKNALDLHIAYYIGQMAAKDATAYFHIISKDRGFDPLIQHLKSKHIFSARSESVADIPLVKTNNTQSPDERAKLFVTKLELPKATRPRSLKSLTSAIGAMFQKQLTNEEITEVISSIRNSGFISIVEGKVIYTQNG